MIEAGGQMNQVDSIRVAQPKPPFLFITQDVKHQPYTVWGPISQSFLAIVGGDASWIGAIGVHQIQVGLAVALRDKRQPFAIGRPPGRNVITGFVS